MNRKNYQSSQVMGNIHGVHSVKLYDSSLAICMHLTLAPGEQLKPHITPVDVLFYVLEGEPVIEIGDEKLTAVKDDLIESPSGIPHCIYNEGKNRVRVLVMKIPRPVSPTKMV